jgi:hypothetical protein
MQYSGASLYYKGTFDVFWIRDQSFISYILKIIYYDLDYPFNSAPSYSASFKL